MSGSYSPNALSFSPADVVRLGSVEAMSAPIDEVVEMLRIAARWEAEARMRRIQTYNRLFEIVNDGARQLGGRGEDGLAALRSLASSDDPHLAGIAQIVVAAQVAPGDRARAAEPAGEAATLDPVRDYGPPAIVTVDEVAAVAADLGATHVAPIAMGLMRPSLMVVPTPTPLAALSLGASRLGGQPDLPEATPWPRHGPAPLSFLAQIDLRDVHRLMAAPGLPAAGCTS